MWTVLYQYLTRYVPLTRFLNNAYPKGDRIGQRDCRFNTYGPLGLRTPRWGRGKKKKRKKGKREGLPEAEGFSGPFFLIVTEVLHHLFNWCGSLLTSSSVLVVSA